jgi:hypothetical protein
VRVTVTFQGIIKCEPLLSKEPFLQPAFTGEYKICSLYVP